MVTRDFVINFRYLEDLIEKDKKELERLKSTPPQVVFDKVMGSNSQFPYEPKNFKLEGVRTAEFVKFNKKITALEKKIAMNIRFYESTRLEIIDLIANIKNPRDKRVFQMLIYEKKTQEQIAKKLYVSQSVVSRTIDKYIEKN